MSFSDPQRNIEQLGLSEGMIVADLGAGSGFYTLACARAVGSDGRVFVVDIQKDLLDKVKHSVHAEGLYNVETIWGNLEKIGGTKIKESSIDVAVVSNVLFQIEQKEEFLNEIKRILKPKARVLLIEWSESGGGLGPTLDDVVTEPKAEELFKRFGFSVDKKISAGEHHYGIVFRKES